MEKAENKAPRAKEASAERNGEARNNDNRNNRNRRNQGDNANRERNNRANNQPAEQERRNPAPAEAAAAPRDSEPREPAQNRRRNNERNRNQNERRHEAEAVAQTEVVSLAAVAEEAVAAPVAVEAQAADSDTQADNKRSRSNERNSQERNRNQRERRNNGKKRNIPSAAKIEQYLMIDEAGDKVRNAVAHVFGEAVEAPVAVSVPAAAVAQPEAVQETVQIDAATPLLFAIEADEAPAQAAPVAADEQVMVSDAAAQVKQAVAQLFEQASVAAVDEDAVPVAPVAVAQSQPEAVAVRADFAGFDLGGLVLVQTRVEALAAAAAAPQPEAEPALRRADLPKAAIDAAPDMPLVQVETRG